MQLKQNLLNNNSGTLIPATRYSSIQNYFDIDLILTIMFTFYIENNEPFRSLRKNCLNLDKNNSTVSTFSIFVVYRSAPSTIQKSN